MLNLNIHVFYIKSSHFFKVVGRWTTQALKKMLTSCAYTSIAVVYFKEFPDIRATKSKLNNGIPIVKNAPSFLMIRF